LNAPDTNLNWFATRACLKAAIPKQRWGSAYTSPYCRSSSGGSPIC